MNLNKKDREEMRSYVEKRLKYVPQGVKIHFDKDFLELLLFEKDFGTLKSGFDEAGEKVMAKFVVWNGSFLSKIDLSEVSFEDVIWNLEYYNYFEEDFEYYSERYQINLSNTNANIDFEKSFNGKHKFMGEYILEIISCDFSNTDLSNNYNYINKNVNINIEDSALTNSGLNIDVTCLTGLSSFKYTVGLNFICPETDEELLKEMIESQINIGFSINGKRIFPKEKIINNDTPEQRNYKDTLKASISNDIDRQLKLFKKQ